MVLFPKPQLMGVTTRTQVFVCAPEPCVCKKEHFQQSQKQVKRTSMKNHTGITELALEWEESAGWGLLCLFQDCFLQSFKSLCFQELKPLVLAKVSFYLRHKGNNSYHSNKGANSLYSLLPFLTSASRQEHPFPVLINRWLKAHLEVESFIENLITDPDFVITSRDAHIICR